MPQGFLKVMVTTQGTLPLKDAKITVINSDTMKELDDKTSYTDENGQTGEISLDTVPREYSLNEDDTVMPYTNYNLTVVKDGFILGEVIGVQIFEGENSLQNVDLLPRPTDYGSGFEIQYAQGEPEKLFDIEPNLQEGISSYILQTVVIPTSVTVHLGKPTASASNVTIPFLTYLKSVAASEIYPTWPYEALKANILCQVTFILNRIYTEWYRSKGYNFDITNSTSYDQKYIHNRSTFETTDRVVEEVFNNYVTKAFNKEPFFTEYCDGKTVKCNGLSQWGACYKAQAGENALQILKDYYGNDVQVNESNNITAIPASYPGTPLKKGSTGQNVEIIQAQLNRIGDNYPSIKKLNVDGVFGDAMTASVKAFQKIFNLTQDGVIGKTTWYKISYIYVAVKKLAELTSEGEAIKNGSYPGYVVKRGDKGINVMIIQYYINQTAVYVDSIDPVKLDGVFGPGLEAQVINFQKFFNLTPDGKVGALTWNKMFEIFLSIKNGITAPPQIPPSNATYPGTPLKIGSTGVNVTKIQEWLNGVAQVYPSVPSIAVDGRFGPATQQSVMAFQTRFALTVDGIVGPATWNKLYNTWQDLVAQNLI